MRCDGGGVREKGGGMKEKGGGRRGGVGEVSQFGSIDPDPWKIFRIRIWQNDADPSEPDPQHCLQPSYPPCTLYNVHTRANFSGGERVYTAFVV